MIKRLMNGVLGLALFSAFTLSFWQPEFLKKKILDKVAKGLTESTPDEMSVGGVSGNLFSGFTLLDIRLKTKNDHREILRARSVRVGLDYRALLHRSIVINRLDWEEPTLRLIIDGTDPFSWATSSHSGRPPEAIPLTIKLFTIEGGRVIIVNRLRSPAKELVFEDVELKARASLPEVNVDSLHMALGQGRISLKGQMNLGPLSSSQWTVMDSDVPIHTIWSTFGTSPTERSVLHSGEWNIRTNPRHATVTMNGQLMDSPISLHVLWAESHLVQAGLNWTRPGLASANVHLFHEEGNFDIRLTTATLNAVIQGHINLAQRSVRGKAAAHDVVWQGKRMDSIEASFFISPPRQEAQLSAKNIRFGQDERPTQALSTAKLSIAGNSPRWNVAANLQWQNGMSLDLAGNVSDLRPSWRLDWRRLTVQNSLAGAWSNSGPGDATIRSNGSVVIHTLSLAHGGQNVQIPQATIGRDAGQIELLFHELDLASWAKLYRNDLTLEGQLNGSVHVAGAWKDPDVDGFLNGHIKQLAFEPAGLLLQNIDVDIQSAHKTLEIRRFSAQSKKSSFEFSGKSHLPSLAYTLRAQHLILQGNPRFKGIAEADVHLDGTLGSPVLSGRISLDEGTYSVPPKEKKDNKESSSNSVDQSTNTPTTLSLWRPGTVDISLSWPRHVWYRDGITGIETQGDLRLQKRKQTADAILSGSIRSIRGSYNYYGRNFTIESGEIQFPGTIDIAPVLNVEASYTSGPTTVYLDLTGPLKQPVLKLHSNPPLSYQDIVAVMVFGQPLSELHARTGGASSNQEMMQAAGGVLGTYVSKGLNQTGIAELNFDLLNIQPADQGGSQLMVGRYLTQRLFVSYGQTVQGAAEKTLTADYFLTDKWTLQGASDSAEGNYMDILFRYPLNRRGGAANNPPLPKSPFRHSLDVPVPGVQFRTPMQ